MSDPSIMEGIAGSCRRARVLDLGCGNGRLMAYLQAERGCSGYGVEIDDARVQACLQRGVNDAAVQPRGRPEHVRRRQLRRRAAIDTLQHLRNAETMLRETVRVGKRCIVAFPNFAHWPNRLGVLRGRMPVTSRMPYQWYDTPNIPRRHLRRLRAAGAPQRPAGGDSFGLQDGQVVRWQANLLASTRGVRSAGLRPGRPAAAAVCANRSPSRRQS